MGREKGMVKSPVWLEWRKAKGRHKDANMFPENNDYH